MHVLPSRLGYGYPLEFTFIIGHHDVAKGSGMGGDEQIVVNYRLANEMRVVTDFSKANK